VATVSQVCETEGAIRWQLRKLPGGLTTKTENVGNWVDEPPEPSEVIDMASDHGEGRYRFHSYGHKSRPGPSATFRVEPESERPSTGYDERATTKALVDMAGVVQKQTSDWQKFAQELIKTNAKLMKEIAELRVDVATKQEGWLQMADTVAEVVAENPHLLQIAGQGLAKTAAGVAGLVQGRTKPAEEPEG
jgi:hypothetical protein